MSLLKRTFSMKKTLLILCSSLLVLTGCNKSSKKVEPITAVTLERNNVTLNVGDRYKLNVTLTGGDENSKIYYYSMNPKIAAINSQGYITAVAKGETNILVHANDIEQVCHVRVSTPVVDNVLVRNGSVILSFDGGDYIESRTFNSPLELAYTARDGLLVYRENNEFIANTDVLKTTVTENKAQQIRNNISYMSFITNFRDSEYGVLLDDDRSGEDRAFAAHFQALEKKISEMSDDEILTYSEEHNENFFSYYGKDIRSTGGYVSKDTLTFYEEELEDKEESVNTLDLIKAIISLIQRIDFENNELEKIDYIGLLSQMSDGDLISEETNATLSAIGNTLAVILGGVDVKKESYIKNSKNYVNLDFTFNGNAKKAVMRVVLGMLGLPTIMSNLFDMVNIGDVGSKVTLYRGDDGHTHIAGFEFYGKGQASEDSKEIGVHAQINIDENAREDNNLFKTVDARNYRLRNDASIFDKFYAKLNYLIDYSNLGFRRNEISITKDSIALYEEALSQYPSLPDSVKGMLEGGYDELKIQNELLKIKNSVNDVVNSLDFSTIDTVDKVIEALEDIIEYKDWDLRLKEENESHYNSVKNIQNSFLEAFSNRIDAFKLNAESVKENNDKAAVVNLIDEYSSIITFYQDFVGTLVIPAKYSKRNFVGELSDYFDSFEEMLVSNGTELNELTRLSTDCFVRYVELIQDDTDLFEQLLDLSLLNKCIDGYSNSILGIRRSHEAGSLELRTKLNLNTETREKIVNASNAYQNNMYDELMNLFKELVKAEGSEEITAKKAAFNAQALVVQAKLLEVNACETAMYGYRISDASIQNKINALIDMAKDIE